MFTLLIFILCFIGWVLNIFKLATDNDTVGVCFTGGKDEVKSWLDESYPGWTQ